MHHIEHAEVARAYARWCKECLQALAAGKRVQTTWSGQPLNYEQWRAEFWQVLERRIALKAGSEPNWRKLDSIYQTGIQRDCQKVREIVTKRARHYQFETAEVQKRFGHLLSHYDD